MAKYKVGLSRIFVYEVIVEAPSKRLAEKQAVAEWSVPRDTGEHMDEELWTMQRGLEDGSLVGQAIVTGSLGVRAA